MNLSRFKNLPLRTQFSVLAAVVLAFGVFVAVQSSQQSQQDSSHASSVCAQTVGDLEVDNCNLDGSIGGNLKGSNNTISGNVGGFVVGDSNRIGVNVGKSIFGNSNWVGNNVAGCIEGNNNTVVNNVLGSVTGTGNSARQVANYGTCQPNPYLTPTAAPTQVPTSAPTSVPTAVPTQALGNCSDGIDNNQNELIDGQDPACHTDGNQNNNNSYDPHLNEGNISPTPGCRLSGELGGVDGCVTPTGPSSRCSDNIDNDNNGFKDNGDSSCHTDGNPNNPNSYDPNRDGEHGNGNTCADSRDNNNNGLIDGADPVCHTDGNPNNPNSYDPNRQETGTGVTPSVVPTVPVSIVPTVPTGNFKLYLKLLLHGLGQGGDSANPTSGGNANPLHKQRTAKVEIYNSQNALVLTKDGPINFNSAAGDFTGTVDLGSNFASGSYIVKVKTSQFLRTIVPGIQNISQSGTQLPTTVMVNGDVNNDNVLNILDYNLLMGCYSDFTPATSCTPENKLLTDLDDDGDVNQFDYNLFLRELANRQGQ